MDFYIKLVERHMRHARVYKKSYVQYKTYNARLTWTL
jgi:hypothetical protein